MRGHQEWPVLSPRLGPARFPQCSAGLAAPALSQEGPQGVWDPHRALGMLNPPRDRVSKGPVTGWVGRRGGQGARALLKDCPRSAPLLPPQLRERGQHSAPDSPVLVAALGTAIPASLSISRGTSPFPRPLHPHPRAPGGPDPTKLPPNPGMAQTPEPGEAGSWRSPSPRPEAAKELIPPWAPQIPPGWSVSSTRGWLCLQRGRGWAGGWERPALAGAGSGPTLCHLCHLSHLCHPTCAIPPV